MKKLFGGLNLTWPKIILGAMLVLLAYHYAPPFGGAFSDFD